jgi:hypothetical protein
MQLLTLRVKEGSGAFSTGAFLEALLCKHDG